MKDGSISLSLRARSDGGMFDRAKRKKAHPLRMGFLLN
jgi:hypothetical protein